MPADIIVGLQWGDEGKGKVVDLISANYDIVVRYQGGANAGHTVVINKKKYVLHLIPSGIFSNKICVIGNGTVLDLQSIIEEIRYLNDNNIDVKNKLFISSDAHIILPYHKLIDSYNEEGNEKIGTTKKGIGPAYIDKYSRCGIKISDLENSALLKSKIKNNIKNKLKNFCFIENLSAKEIADDLLSAYNELKQYVRNTQLFLSESVKEKNILLEGAQGCLLDVDFGTYPYVTSSHPTAGGACTGSGIAPIYIKNTIGISKAYTTRVGEGPFPTELKDEIGQKIRDIGNEYGATTQRPRRCGWLDLVALNYACKLNGVTHIALTKADVLNSFEKILVSTKYKYNGSEINEFLPASYMLCEAEPVYTELRGWNTDIKFDDKIEDLNENLRNYISFIENYTKVKIKFLSIGSDRKDTIVLN